MIGLLLLAVLFSYADSPTGYREAVGFSAAVGICLLLTLGVFLDRVIRLSGWPTPADPDARMTIDEVTPWWTSGWEALITWLALSACVYATWAMRQRSR